MIRFARKALGADRDALTFWLSVGGELVLADGVHRVEREVTPDDLRQPSPCPVPEALVRDAIRSGAIVRRDGDLFGGAA